jgi:hypothetical protein
VATLTHSQVIPRPVDDVFEVVVDGGRFAEWNPTVKSSRQLTEGPIGNGTRFEWELSGFGRVVQELAEFDRSRRVRIVPQLRSLKGGHRFTFSSVPDGTRIDHELEMSPQGLFRLLGPMTARVGRRNLLATAAALGKRLSTGGDSGTPAPPAAS